MSLDADALYALLPAVYRTRDAAAGGQLRALFGVLAAQSDLVSQNIAQLYDDQFIETCAPWAIPYVGDLIGYNAVYELAGVTDSRAEVANTIGYRRRKGTKIALQQVAIDTSGRPAVVVEEFQRLITTESMRLVRPGHAATVSLRNGPLLRALGHASGNGISDSPFDAANRTVDVRRIAPRFVTPACGCTATPGAPGPDLRPLDTALHGPGRANITDVAVHLWRWQAFGVNDAPAFAVDARRYKVSPLGQDLPLFTPLRLPESFTALLSRDDVPEPIGRAELARLYGAAVTLVADGVPVDASRVYGANLADRPGGAWCEVPAGKVAIDPELGRIQFAAGDPAPRSLTISYWYGFPAAIGGGPYDRTQALSGQLPASPGFTVITGSADCPTLESAVAAWNAYATGTDRARGIIVLPGTAALAVDLTGAAAVTLPPGSELAVVAGQQDLTWHGSLITLTGDIEVTGLPAPAPTAGTVPPPGQLLVSGIWLAGQLTVSGAPATVAVSDATLVPGHGLLPDGTPLHPGEPSVLVTADGASLSLTRVISGPVAAAGSGSTVITASVVDATSPYYVAYASPDLASAGPDLCVTDSTVIGKVRARTITLASNSIFHARLGDGDPWLAPVWASRRQAGCVRFCWLPDGSVTPRQYECLPPSAGAIGLAPRFISVRYGGPAYALLSGDCPVAIWTGADNGSQLGAYKLIQETEAVSNVQIRAPEYLPPGWRQASSCTRRGRRGRPGRSQAATATAPGPRATASPASARTWSDSGPGPRKGT